MLPVTEVICAYYYRYFKVCKSVETANRWDVQFWGSFRRELAVKYENNSFRCGRGLARGRRGVLCRQQFRHRGVFRTDVSRSLHQSVTVINHA